MGGKGKGKGKGSGNAAKHARMAHQPAGAQGWLACPNKASCSMAARRISWVWDFGPHTQTDVLSCYECDFAFKKARTGKSIGRSGAIGSGAAGGNGAVGAVGGSGAVGGGAPAAGGGAAPPAAAAAAAASAGNNNVNGGGKAWGKGGNRTPPNPKSTQNLGLPELDMDVLFEKLKVCKSAQELHSSLKDLCTPPVKPKVLTPSEEVLKLGRFIKHNETRELQLVASIDNFKKGIVESTATLLGLQVELANARIKHDLCLEALKSKQVQPQAQGPLDSGNAAAVLVDTQDLMGLGNQQKAALIQQLSDSLPPNWQVEADNSEDRQTSINRDSSIIETGDEEMLTDDDLEPANAAEFDAAFIDAVDDGAEIPRFGRAEITHPARPAPYLLTPNDRDDELFATPGATPAGAPMTQAAYASLSPDAQLAVASEIFGHNGTHRPAAAPVVVIDDVASNAEPIAPAVGDAEPATASTASASTGAPSG